MSMVEIYLTKEQIQRIAAISLDSLVGCQIGSTISDQTTAIVTMADVDSPSDNRQFDVYADGSFLETT